MSQVHNNNNTADDPWLPVVLSLDGGGVRGLSALFILRRIMLRIQDKISQQHDDPVASARAMMARSEKGNGNAKADSKQPVRSTTMPTVPSYHPDTGDDPWFHRGDKLPLPCWYFDYMVGTSTGGLIAVMLGRLRMSVDDAIKQYWMLSNYIFRPRRVLIPYDHEKLEKSIKQVVRNFCKCHGGRPCGNGGANEPLQQYDYAELGDAGAPQHLNYSCKVALVAQRHKTRGGDATYLFRSYSHYPRFTHSPSEMNPEVLINGNGPKIWEACRASTAAPFYFKEMIIDGHVYMDGGVGNNNPADLAWNEAKFMANRSEPKNGKVLGLVSLGTGMARPESRFGMKNLLRWTRKAITETGRAHRHIRDRAMDAGAEYWRFDVQPGDGHHDGLASIKLNECKRARRKKKKEKAKSPESSVSGDGDAHWHDNLQLEAMDEERRANKRRNNGGYNPVKYEYTTFDNIFERTERYCTESIYEGTKDVNDAIDECADFLLKVARDRWKKNRMRFRRFVSHPNPRHEDYLPPLTALHQSEVQDIDDSEGDRDVRL